MRRRLIGAVALTLLVVILLPTVFDSEPAPATGNDIELRIPNKDNAGEFQPRIDLPEIDKMASEVAATSAVEVTPAAVAPAKPVVKPIAKPAAPAAAAATPKPETKPKAASKPAAKPQFLPLTGWAVQVGAFANAEAAKAIKAKLSSEGFHAYTEIAGDVTRVRVGSYPTREAAEKVQAKLTEQGMQANVVTLE